MLIRKGVTLGLRLGLGHEDLLFLDIKLYDVRSVVHEHLAGGG